MSKGVSPIIASVLLMAVTLSMASIFAGWGPNIVRTVTDTTSNQTEETLDCNQASVEIIEAKYYNTADPDVAVVVRNTGPSVLDDLQVSAWAANLPLEEKTISVEGGNYNTTNISVSERPDTVQAFSQDCSSVRDTYEQIK